MKYNIIGLINTIVIFIMVLVIIKYVTADDCYNMNANDSMWVDYPCYLNGKQICLYNNESYRNQNTICTVYYNSTKGHITYSDDCRGYISRDLQTKSCDMMFNNSDRIVYIDRNITIQVPVEKIVDKIIYQERIQYVNTTQDVDKIVYQIPLYMIIITCIEAIVIIVLIMSLFLLK